MLNEKETRDLIDRLSALEAPVLTIYADVNPANPDNKAGAWRTRIKNALKDIPQIHERSEHRPSLHDAVLEVIGQERPDARTMALFAKQNHLGKTFIERVDLQVDLPVVDLRAGRTEARYGEAWLGPFFYALDEYQRSAVLHLDRTSKAGWKLYEIFMGEIREIDDAFADLDEADWKELHETAGFIRERLLEKTEPDFIGNSRDTWKQKISAWGHKLHRRLASLLDKALVALGIDRLVLVGEEQETSHLVSLMPRRLRDKVVARLHNPHDPEKTTPAMIRELAEPALEQAERAGEMALLDEIREQPGITGLGPVLEAVQLGRIDTLVLPFDIDATLWTCPDTGVLAAERASLAALCEDAREVALRDRIFDLAREFGTRLEFVRGEARARLIADFDGIAGKRRW